MNIPSFDDFLKTLTDEDIEEIKSKVDIKEILQGLDTKNNLDMMTAVSLNSASICLSTFLTLLRRYHDWLTKFL